MKKEGRRKKAQSEPEASKAAEAFSPSTSAITRRKTPHAPMRLTAARVLKGALEGPPLLPLVAEANKKKMLK